MPLNRIDWTGLFRINYTPVNLWPTVLGHSLLNAPENVEIIPYLIEQIISARGIRPDATAADCDPYDPAHSRPAQRASQATGDESP